MEQTSPEEAYQVCSVVNLLVVPSRFEGFGLVAAGAMAAGLPVVATKIDELAELLEDGVTGMLIPPGDIQPPG